MMVKRDLSVGVSYAFTVLPRSIWHPIGMGYGLELWCSVSGLRFWVYGSGANSDTVPYRMAGVTLPLSHPLDIRAARGGSRGGG